MRILLDTNIVIDYLQKRSAYFEHAQAILLLCQRGDITGFVSTQTIADTFYILRKDYPVTDLKGILINFCKILYIVGVDEDKLFNALIDAEFDDFEDCLQSECAKSVGVDYIVTRNVSDYGSATIPAVTPEAFFKRFESGYEKQ
ncbi:MAG: PIN domain-containing protein [Fusobacteriaceae bacterium]|jgi:predicted nucleic acid-binding protein|nr:PIN domain-containing protein [Fusobacteriaceae bacterium]